MSASWATFLFEAANFLLLAALLGWLFFRPVRAALERRRDEIEAERREAEKAHAEAERALREIQARRAELEGSLEELRARVQGEAEAERERLLEEARGRMQREHEALKDDLVALRRAQARAAASDAAFAARQIVVRLLQEMQGPDLEGALARAACRELETLRASGPLAPILVESATALDEPALAELREAGGVSASEISQRVDPELIAGLRVVTGRGLVDASAAGLAEQAERVLLSRLERESGDLG